METFDQYPLCTSSSSFCQSPLMVTYFAFLMLKGLTFKFNLKAVVVCCCRVFVAAWQGHPCVPFIEGVDALGIDQERVEGATDPEKQEHGQARLRTIIKYKCLPCRSTKWGCSSGKHSLPQKGIFLNQHK